MSVRTQVKGTLWLIGIVAVVVLIGPHVGFDPFEDAEVAFGPSKPGMDKRFGCRYMSLDVEMTLTKQQDEEQGLNSMNGRLSAQLGPPSKPINNQRITVPDFAQTRAYFKQEFCSKPGSPLSATVTMDEPVNSISCYFYWGPDADAHDATTRFSGIPRGDLMQVATCAGVVPG